MEGTCWDKLDFSYVEPNQEFIEKEFKKVEELLDIYCKITDIPKERIQVNAKALKEIIIRLDMRRLYFHIYHKKMNANEYKVNAGLFVFWILKLRPFWMQINQDDSDDMIEIATTINEKISLHIAMSLLKEYNSEFFQYGKDLVKAYTKELEYSFRYRDLSKESMFLMFDPFYYLHIYHDSIKGEGDVLI